ncbi:hypothetical protein AB0K60_29765 [Thermopolyspora sp. NPDC052614]|uniref:hypothetical protein n=1 Tax=Thermopolyspora sp. NPDC052614 TaxID=3155682 RepID=UPI00342BA36F
MSSPEQLRSLTDVPDHGLGPLGRLAHGVLTECLAAPPAAPRLYLGHNILPDPPFPLSGYIAFPAVDDAWRASGQDLSIFLTWAAESLRAQPRPSAASFGEQHQMLNRLLRIDAIALVWEVRVVVPTESMAGWTLAADVLAGRVGREELADAAAAEPALAVWTVDRAGSAVLMFAPPGGTADDIAYAGDLLDSSDPVVARLADVLDAQYEWTSAVFGADA